jgi:hypothetical protein
MEKLRKVLTLSGRVSTWYWLFALMACKEPTASKLDISFSCAEE